MSRPGVRLPALPRPLARSFPSFLAVEVGVALVPYVAFVGLSALTGVLASSGYESLTSPALALGLLGALAAVALPLLLLVHAFVDLGRFALDRSGPWPARHVARVAVRVLETVGAYLYLEFLREGWAALDGLESEPAGVGILLGFVGGFVLLSGLVFAHGLGRVALAAGTEDCVVERSEATETANGER